MPACRSKEWHAGSLPYVEDGTEAGDSPTVFDPEAQTRRELVEVSLSHEASPARHDRRMWEIAYFLRPCGHSGFEVSSGPISPLRRTWPSGAGSVPTVSLHICSQFGGSISNAFSCREQEAFQAADCARAGVRAGRPVRFVRDADSSRPVWTAELGRARPVDRDPRRFGCAAVWDTRHRRVRGRLRGRLDLFAGTAGSSIRIFRRPGRASAPPGAYPPPPRSLPPGRAYVPSAAPGPRRSPPFVAVRAS